jgi:polyisoprenoid-binding protein YceI
MRFILLPVLALAMPAMAAPQAWTVVPAASSITFSGTHAGSPFSGKFGQWAAQIAFDPADLPHSSARVTIATASGKTGDGLRDTSLTQDDWFDPAHFPRATFVTSKISAAGPDRYVADGVLTIKGKAVPVKLPFTLKIVGATATMNGSVAVDRLAFRMGAQADPQGAFVSKQISLKIAVTAKK